MNHDEFAFLNQQLAAMLRDGIPLEGALKRLCGDMRRGELKAELEKLEADLSKGVPIEEALNQRRLPDFYVRMLQVGVQSNDLPGVLLLVADYYQRTHSIWTRLKGLMVYPVILLFAAFGLSAGLSVVFGSVMAPTFSDLGGQPIPASLLINLWAPPVFIASVFLLVLAGVSVPRFRHMLRWRLSPFREASLASIATAMRLMLKSGTHLNDALGLMQQLEGKTRAGRELAHWRERLAAGQGKFSELASAGKAFPPLFVWLVANAGEDLDDGFGRAAEIYQARAAYRGDLLLYAALPFSILALGVMILGQVYLATKSFNTMLHGWW